jgi:hypothetical protein
LTLRTDAALTSPTWAGDTIFTLGFFHTGRLAAFLRDGRFARFLGTAPSKPGEPVVITQHAYQSVMRPSPDRRLFAAAARYAGRLKILRRDGSREVDAQVPDAFDPSYTVVHDRGEPKMLRDAHSRLAYIDVATDSAFIYALFSGRTESDVGMYLAARMIHVFDWRGRLIDRYELPNNAIALALDRRRHRLYAMHTTPRPTIAVYQLPSRVAR